MPGSAFERGRVSLSHGHLAYHCKGDGERTLLFIHGLGDNGLCWSRTADALADRYRVVLLDSRGHGESSMPPAGHIDDPANDLGEVLDRLEIEQVNLIGHSVGAVSAAMFTAANNARVTRLVLEDPPFRGTAYRPPPEVVSGFKAQMEAFREMGVSDVIASGRKQHPTWAAAEFADWATAKRQVNPEIMGHFSFPAWRDVIGNIDVPTLVVHGAPESDSMVSAERAEAMTALNPKIRTVSIPDAGHNVRRENFEAYVRCVREFLADTLSG